MEILLRVAFSMIALAGSPQGFGASAPLVEVQHIPLPGVEGRIDHMAVDEIGQRLFIAALGNNSVEVVDLAKGTRVHSITGLKVPQDVRFVPTAHQLFVSNGDGGACEVFDDTTFQHQRTIAFGDDADNVRLDAVTQLLYVGYGGGALGIVDVRSDAKVASITLAGHPESFQLDRDSPRIFVNVPSAHHVAVVDRVARKVIATWPLDGARSNFPMALDAANHRLFVGCREPATLLVYDTETGTIAARLPIAGDSDDLLYDSTTKRLIVTSGAGFIDIFQQRDADHYAHEAQLATAIGARTSAFAPTSRRLYLAVPHRGQQVAEIRVYTLQP